MTASNTSGRRATALPGSAVRALALTGMLVLLGTFFPAPLSAQRPVVTPSPQVLQQITALLMEKEARTPTERKISSRLLYALRATRGEPIASGIASLRSSLPDVNEGGVVLDLRAGVSDALLASLRALGGDIIHASPFYRSIRLRIDLRQVEAIAALPEVRYVQAKQEAATAGRPVLVAEPLSNDAQRLAELRRRKRLQRSSLLASIQRAFEGSGPTTSVGSAESQGDLAHKAHVARASFGVRGAGVKIGVLSDGVISLAQSQALGDLGPVTVLPGQTGEKGDEGTAMLEIIHDLAPDAELYFATAFTSLASFAENIRALRAAGCDIIVDDVSYFVESPFQDGQTYLSPANGGIVTQAVKEVAASGALFFSSASNSGNKNDGTSGTWEGDFVDGGPASTPRGGQLHNFGSQTYNVFTGNADAPITLHWSDPLGGSANDYDLFILNSAGTTIYDASTDIQDGDDDPIEGTGRAYAGERVIIVKVAGSARFLHLATNRNRLEISTAGETHGHSSTTAPNSFGVAATPAQSPGPYPAAFNSGNSVETFSSDGPRRLFFDESGSALTPGNVSGSGGIVLQKPDFTAADGVAVTGVGGFPNPFYGTSAAAPHAAAIAALVKSRNATQTAADVRRALFSSAIDIEAPGADRDSGVGVLMADAAVAAAFTDRNRRRNDFDGDGKVDFTIWRPSDASWYVLNSAANFTTGTVRQWGGAGDVLVPGDYDGDGKTDPAVFRPASGIWYVLLSGTNFTTYFAHRWGVSTDAAVPADYDGDGRTDLAIYRPSTNTWWILQSGTGSTTYVTRTWGAAGDTPVPADYDGDGKADLGIYRPRTGTWWMLLSSTDSTSYTTVRWGDRDDTPLPADYDGDGKADFGLFRPSTGVWYLLETGRPSMPTSVQWGASTDTPVPADYDGDGKADVAIFRPENGSWYVISSSDGFQYSRQWGLAGDVSVVERP